MLHRTFRAFAATAILLALSAGIVTAGGWATIAADAGNPQPTAGEELGFGFIVLQHGVTPISSVKPTFVARNVATGRQVSVAAVNQGEPGHFVATVTLPDAGYWTWEVQLTELIVETPPQTLTVRTAAGVVPSLDTTTVVASIERTRSELHAQVRDELYAETDVLRQEIAVLTAKADVATAERNALQARIDAVGQGGVPLVGVVAIAVLAGALAAVLMTVLARPGQAANPRTEVAGETVSTTGVVTTR